MLCKRGVDGFFQLLLLIEAGNHDRNERRAGKRRRGIMGRPVPLPVKPEIEAACHPQRRHEQRIEEYEIEQERSEEHTSELQSLMRISYAVFCLKKKNKKATQKADKKQRIRDKTQQQHITSTKH